MKEYSTSNWASEFLNKGHPVDLDQSREYGEAILTNPYFTNITGVSRPTPGYNFNIYCDIC